MHIKYRVNHSVLEIEASISKKVNNGLYRVRELYLDKSIKVPYGDYRGRWAKVTGCSYYWSDGFLLVVSLYRINGGRNNGLLDDSFCIRVNEVEIVSNYVNGDMIKNWNTPIKDGS